MMLPAATTLFLASSTITIVKSVKHRNVLAVRNYGLLDTVRNGVLLTFMAVLLEVVETL